MLTGIVSTRFHFTFFNAYIASSMLLFFVCFSFVCLFYLFIYLFIYSFIYLFIYLFIFVCFFMCCTLSMPASMAQTYARPTGDQEVAVSIPVGSGNILS